MPPKEPRYFPAPSRAVLDEDIARTQRQAYLLAYETRRRQDSLFSLGRQLDIPRQVVIRWLQDPEFQRALMAADSWRVAIVRDVFAREMQGIAENLAQIAKERWPHSVRAAEAVQNYMLGPPAGEDHRLQAVSIDQLNVFAAKPTEDQLTEVLRAKEKHDRIIRRYLKGVEVAHEIVGAPGASGRPRGRHKRPAGSPGQVPEGGPPPGA